MLLFILDALLVVPPTIFSVYHYIRARGTVEKDIPVHYGIDGSPDRFADASYFAVYPALCILLAAASIIGAHFMLDLLGVFFSLTMGSSLLLLCATQYYSVSISKGELTQIPRQVFYPLLIFITLSTIALVVYSVVFASQD